MQTIRITTSQNIDIEYEIAGVGDRVLARIIDLVLTGVVIFALVITATVTGNMDSDFLVGVFIVVAALIYGFYDLLCEIFMNGQSVGKRVMKIRVISLDGGQASLGQYLLRWVFRIVDFTLTASLCGLISAAVTKKCQRVGDMVAGTTLIKTTSRAQFESIAFTPHVADYNPVFAEATQLNDRDVALIHEVLSNYIQSGNYEVLWATSNKLKTLLGITTKMDDMQFLQTLVRDHNHYVTVAHEV